MCVAVTVAFINPLDVDRQRIRNWILHANVQLFIFECSSTHFNKMHISHELRPLPCHTVGLEIDSSYRCTNVLYI